MVSCYSYHASNHPFIFKECLDNKTPHFYLAHHLYSVLYLFSTLALVISSNNLSTGFSQTSKPHVQSCMAVATHFRGSVSASGVGTPLPELEGCVQRLLSPWGLVGS